MDVEQSVEISPEKMKAASAFNGPAATCFLLVNYLEFIDPSKRDRKLKMLQQLLTESQSRWRETIFMTFAETGNPIAGKQ